MKAFKAARLFSPHRLSEIQPSAGDIGILRAFLFLDNEVNSLQAELPTYLSLSADVNATTDTLKWWKDHHEDLPHWSSAEQKLSLVQLPSAAKRVFSLLPVKFTQNGNKSLDLPPPCVCILKAIREAAKALSSLVKNACGEQQQSSLNDSRGCHTDGSI